MASNTFSWAANSITGRDYHSGGILLPNGSVLTLGGNPLFGNKQDTEPQTFNQEIDVYYPPYMFQGDRPAIQSAPSVMSPGRELPHQGVRPVERPVPAADATGQSHPRDRRQRAFGGGQLHPGRPRLPAGQHPGQREHHPAELLHAVRGERQRACRPRPPGFRCPDDLRAPSRAARAPTLGAALLPSCDGTSSRTRKELPCQRPAAPAAELANACWPYWPPPLSCARWPAAPIRTRRSARLYTFPGSPLLSAATFLRANGQQGAAAALEALAATPSGIWAVGAPDDMEKVGQAARAAAAAHEIPVIVAYNLPGRDACGKFSAAPGATGPAYEAWIASSWPRRSAAPPPS